MRVIFLKNALRLFIIIMILGSSFYLWVNLDRNPQKKQEALKEEVKEDVKEPEIMVHMSRSDGTKEDIELETYLIGVVGSEMPATFELEALKAQAVAARTFVKQRNFEVDDTTSSQVYKNDDELKKVWSETYDERMSKVKQAVDETKGEIITYNGECISAVFFSSTPGKTANADEYWKNETPYLRSVDSPWDGEVNDGNIQEVSFTLNDFATKLGFQNAVSQIGAPVLYDSGYVKEITIDGITFSGREMREKLNLRSSCFKIVNKSDGIYITTTGFGHGIGMSQYGAQGMALEGNKYNEIIKHYYTGVEIEKIVV